MIENKRTPIGLRDTAKGHKESSETRGQGHDPFGKDAGGHDRIFEDTKRTLAGEKEHKKDTGHDPSPSPSSSPSPVQFSEIKFEAIISKRSVHRARSNEPHFLFLATSIKNESLNLNLPYSPRLFSFHHYI